MPVTSPRASKRAFRIAPPAFYGNINDAIALAQAGDLRGLQALLWEIVEWQRLQAETVNGLMNGKDNGTGQLTLTASSATTTLTDKRIGPDTKIVLIPLDSNAAAELVALYQDLPNVTEGEAILNHNNLATVRTFAYALRG